MPHELSYAVGIWTDGRRRTSVFRDTEGLYRSVFNRRQFCTGDAGCRCVGLRCNVHMRPRIYSRIPYVLISYVMYLGIAPGKVSGSVCIRLYRRFSVPSGWCDTGYGRSETERHDFIPFQSVRGRGCPHVNRYGTPVTVHESGCSIQPDILRTV